MGDPWNKLAAVIDQWSAVIVSNGANYDVSVECPSRNLKLMKAVNIETKHMPAVFMNIVADIMYVEGIKAVLIDEKI